MPYCVMFPLRMTDRGLACEAGGFHIDPWGPVERAVITHAHADHTCKGCRHYLASREGRHVLRTRLGNEASIQLLEYGEALDLNGYRLSLHPAGHILGSAQVRIEHRGHVTVFSGDYKIQPDPTCTPFELLQCHSFITESTFGLPVYRWDETERVYEEIRAWWRSNREAGRASVILAYALGKAQSVLMGLDPSMGPVYTHSLVEEMNRRYRMSGVGLPNTLPAERAANKSDFSRAIIVAPSSARGTTWLRQFGEYSTALASGWMRVRGMRHRRGVDRGFVLSDHVDWPGLMETIAATGAEEVHVTHGFVTPVVRMLREKGIDARPLKAKFAADDTTED
ncbi:MAG TPA: ligase-associated DNA damage response exonuclease [Syntrophales bacterium]|nr:ligase-associated DNA damage response exonuclease [Syntrophales bacterium]